MAIDNEGGTKRGPGSDDAYSRRRSNWYIWVAVAVLLAVILYALINGFDYASG